MLAPLTLAVLAGGASRRMGSDKTSLEINGRSMIDHVLAAAGGLPVLVVGREHPAVPSISDAYSEQRGPLGGLVAALEACGGPVLLVGADQPWLRADTVQALAHFDDGPLPVAPLDSGVRQVLCAVYPLSVLPEARRLLEAGRGPQAVLDLGCRDLAAAVWHEWGEDGRSWFSVDTPQALADGLIRHGAPG